MLSCHNGQRDDRKFNAKFHAGMFCIYDSVLVPAASLLFAFPSLVLCVIPLQFAATSKCNVRYLWSVAWQSPLFVNPLPNRVRYCVMPVKPLNMKVMGSLD